MKILIINGPNLNLLGSRETDIYGSMSLDQIETMTQDRLKKRNVTLDWYQSNHEGELIDKIHLFRTSDYDALIINPGAFSHTSVALLDALRSVNKPVIEVHLSNTHSREAYRKTKLTAEGAQSIIEGLGKDVYLVAIIALLIQKGHWND